MPEIPAVTNSGYFQWVPAVGKPPIEGSIVTVHNCRRPQKKLIVY